eukprot:gene8416-12972_t
MGDPHPTTSETKRWKIESWNRTQILTSERVEEIQQELGVTTLPDQLFEDCYLRMESEGIKFDFSAVAAIRCARVSKEEASNDPKCMYYDEWKDKKDIKVFHTGLNWTYDARDFTGLATEGLKVREGGSIDMDLLRNTSQPILHFTSVDLYEDDLDDCGTTKLNLKFRCMATFWFVLLRQFIRVDRVQVMIRDVRWFHKFGTREVVLERIVRKKDIKADMSTPTDAAAHNDDSPPL